MKYNSLMHPRWVGYLPLLAMLMSLVIPASISTATTSIQVVVEEPTLHPASTDCTKDYWYPIPNDRGHTAYLTLNVYNQSSSSNHAEWLPLIPQAGYYRVEAYIAGHFPITWCTGAGRTIDHDTTDAHYSIHHAYGTSTRILSQYPLSNAWLELGIYYFNAGQAGFVSLADLNDETEYSTTVSFSAMRFTYTSATQPLTYLPVVEYIKSSVNPPPDVAVIQAQGFDVCSLPSVATMQNWWNTSPYSFYGLYLGGIQLPGQCGGVTASWVKAVHQQGWSFIPTWVGPQAPCSPWSQKMSADPFVSYQQGRQEAEAASSRAAILGLTNNGLGGTIIYYDMEVYGGASLACRQAAASFMNGWVERLGELGNIAGGYGAHNSYVEGWAAIAHVPKDVWAASWYADSYDPYASANNISWLQGLWTNHQRIRQYAGDHDESWGGKGIVIDSNVADGEVAMPNPNLLASPLVIPSPSVDDSGWLTTDQGWLVSQKHLYWTSNRGKSWKDISPAPVQLAYFLPSGQAWAFSALNGDDPSLYFSSDVGENWERLAFTLPEGDWKPLQLQFTSPASGWLVLQLVTSQAFDAGLLLKTNDGGLTWQAYDLPSAQTIQFTPPSEGWLMNGDNEPAYHTTDGGITWQATPPERFPLRKPVLPAGTTISGWQTDDLGWAATTNGTCQGKKGDPGFICQVDNRLWQSLDGGKTWATVSLPPRLSIKQ